MLDGHLATLPYRDRPVVRQSAVALLQVGGELASLGLQVGSEAVVDSVTWEEHTLLVLKGALPVVYQVMSGGHSVM